jgi:hypothetical protein
MGTGEEGGGGEAEADSAQTQLVCDQLNIVRTRRRLHSGRRLRMPKPRRRATDAESRFVVVAENDGHQPLVKELIQNDLQEQTRA